MSVFQLISTMAGRRRLRPRGGGHVATLFPRSPLRNEPRPAVCGYAGGCRSTRRSDGRRQVDDLRSGNTRFISLLEVVPLDRAVEIVERQGAAAQQELAQDRHFGRVQPQVAGLDDVDPADRSQRLGSSSVRTIGSSTSIGGDRLTRRDRFCSAAGASMAQGSSSSRRGPGVDGAGVVADAGERPLAGRRTAGPAARRLRTARASGRADLQRSSAAARRRDPPARPCSSSRASRVPCCAVDDLAAADPARARSSARFPARPALPAWLRGWLRREIGLARS